ncbi:helix-turn-helix transcriptional regulator [Pseudochryseolinea flava]|uniref:AraC family transcriptional regulator n=1 Tax=Pseudochryseolinea flava TaxID=2059302 RepID=A0A364XX00_9BACT|nr:helix-turn-helix transcriptional regulator [Pseudochryseolinea flava]RAV98948.1 AraC family transcriptional regulator [Pseudochryseolinea flava]
MQVTKFQPSAPLQPFVKEYIVVESQAEVLNRILPDTSLVMAFRFKGDVNQIVDAHTSRLPVSMISGLRKSGRLINYTPGAGNFLVSFREGGASAFFKEPIHLLFDDSISLDSFSHYDNVAGVEDRLAEAATHEQRVDVVDQFLLLKLRTQKTDDVVLNAIARIHASKGVIKMKDLASAICMSQDAFEKRFRKVVGVSPKQFANIVRMKCVVANGRNKPLSTIALEAGYFDQPHFNKDFKLFTGQTPGDFFTTPPAW